MFPDAFVGHIADTYLVPYLNQSDFYDGILYATAFLGQEIITNYTAGSPPMQADTGRDHPTSWLPCTAWQFVIIVVVFVGLVGVTRGGILWWLPLLLGGRRGGGGRS